MARRAREIVETAFDEDTCDTRTIARRLSVTRPRLCHAYRKAYDSTIGQDLRRLRIEAACHLLEADPGALIKEVAAEVGFGRRSYRTFLNAFRRETGASPREYQRHAASRRLRGDWPGEESPYPRRRASGSGRRQD